jgi:DNA-directed RNA polymerase subunit RPC12/RpoP
MIYICEECGDEVREPNADGEWDCVICGGRMKKQPLPFEN